MIDQIKHFINAATEPKLFLPFIVIIFFFVFPPTDRLFNLNRKLKLQNIWTNTGALVMFAFLLIFFAFGITDPNFRNIVTKPDNVPIVGLIFLTVFFLLLSMKQAAENDARTGAGKPPKEADDKEKVLVWPDLVYIEFICLIVCPPLLVNR